MGRRLLLSVQYQGVKRTYRLVRLISRWILAQTNLIRPRKIPDVLRDIPNGCTTTLHSYGDTRRQFASVEVKLIKSSADNVDPQILDMDCPQDTASRASKSLLAEVRGLVD